jgi:hypothetical protein
MSRNSSGTYTLPVGNPVVAGTTIDATWANTTLSDIATEITNSLARTGAGGMTAALRLANGTSTVPGLAWGDETGTGFYRAGTSDTRFVTQTALIQQWTATGSAITGTFSVSGNTTLGDASGDTLTITGTAVTTPNGLNIDSDTLVVDAANNLVGIGTSSPTSKLTVLGADGVNSIRFRAATGMLRINPYQDATEGTVISAANAAESANIPLTISASLHRVTIGGTEVARIDGAGNLGLGVTPSAWSVIKAIQIGSFAGSSIYADNGSTIVGVASNAYYSSTGWRYFGTALASRYEQAIGAHAWYTAPSGTAGNAISFTQAMTLDASGNLLVGTTDTGASGLGISNLLNLTFPEGSGTSYTNLFRQATSAATVLANGYKRSATANGFASSIGVSWAKTAIGLGVSTGAITFYTDAAATVANGTDVTPTERMRIDSSGNLITNVNGTAPSLSTNSTMSFELTSNTSLKIVVRGTDGVTRSATLTLS